MARIWDINTSTITRVTRRLKKSIQEWNFVGVFAVCMTVCTVFLGALSVLDAILGAHMASMAIHCLNERVLPLVQLINCFLAILAFFMAVSRNSHAFASYQRNALQKLRRLRKMSVLPKASFSTVVKCTDDKETKCAICLECFGEKDEVRILSNCSHHFHSLCIDRWLSYGDACPLCRASLRDQFCSS